MIPPQPPARHRSQDEPSIDGAVALKEVLDGDVVFFARPGLLQSLCTRAGEPWRHVGIVATSEGVQRVAEVAGASFGMRDLADAVGASEEVAVARVPAAWRPFAGMAAAWCAKHSGRSQVYAWDDLILAGLIAVSRRYSLPQDRSVLERGVLAATDALATHTVPHAAERYTCSAFVTAAFAEAGYPIAFDLIRPRAAGERPSLFELVRAHRRPLRAAGDTRMSSAQVAASVRALVAGLAATRCRTPTSRRDLVEMIRWSTPGDLWRSISFSERYLVSG